MPTNRRMEKQTVIYSHKGILYIKENEQTPVTIHKATWMNLTNKMLDERTQT